MSVFHSSFVSAIFSNISLVLEGSVMWLILLLLVANYGLADGKYMRIF